jgi:glycosyltransferase involved in cell wall biosynthesis
MRIGIVLSGLVGKARRGGVARYARCLLSALAQVDGRNTYVLFLHRDNASDFDGLPLRWRRVVLPLPRPEARYLEQVVLPPLLYGLRLDVVHYPALAPVLAYPGPAVATVHDLTLELFPDNVDLRSRLYYRRLLRAGVRRARRIIADSESTKGDLCRLWDVPPQFIEVIPLAPAPTFQKPVPASRVCDVLKRYGLPDTYLLGVSTLQPNKNFARLLEAYALARGRLPEDTSLVVVGQPGWRYEGVVRSTRELGLDGSVRFIGYVPDADLAALYSGALAFVYPSLYEGFGLPPLEAMACGAPVIASHASSLPEVVGDAGLLVDPLDVEDIAAAMVRVASDPVLREAMRQAGRARASRFSWQKCAQRTLAVLEAAANGAPLPPAARGG